MFPRGLQPEKRLVRPSIMKPVLIGIGAFFLTALVFAQPTAPEREVRGNRLTSKSDPAITIKVPREARYLGAERWNLYDIADCELHLFVEADDNKRVKALYWIQFEGYLPGNTHTYDYSKDDPVTWSGLPFYKRARFGPSNQAPRAGSDGERVRQMLERAGYSLPPDTMNVRLVHLLDEARRKELMFIYGEDLSASGHTSASLMDGDKPRAEWTAIEKELVARAMKRIQFKH
jgi:hypothetical protein